MRIRDLLGLAAFMGCAWFALSIAFCADQTVGMM
jgi:hypothetical protein